MDNEYFLILAKVRVERAKELVGEAKDLLAKDSYKSANNRAFYAIEKGVKALLATAQIEVSTHSGGLKQFNYAFIHKGDGTFSQEDYQKIAKSEHIRNASDYDDFYIADKKETKEQVDNAVYLVRKIEEYIIREIGDN